MMRDRPSGGQLLALLREVLERDRSMPEERRTDPALIERARAIAAREGRDADAFGDCREILRSLCGEGETALHRLAADIRAGGYDAVDPGRAVLLDLLRRVTVQKLRESNPEFLAGCGLAEA